ncbi:GntR family transcriptional regulator [Oscillibacter ruminantium]|jgi:GntR family transcriptional regulator|uniref:GntR family transcriptional regulator n=1 Tax=Oscillibacter ruminantium TaxID=1263547 RepID=UPI0002F58252|nr:GntR family transcriptional regulator [Oscillibacter ruminantium]MDN0032862.1 GntR family transcriptional regulator [Oscillibacter valericigenes]MEA5042926.1 GntR family transcriptional regulator [Oscillibacter ruminantium]
MDIVLSNATSAPIYEQIATQIKDQIVAGTLGPGHLLPSIRALAKDLRISVITTKRAYDELEADGFVYTVAGKGCFVAEKNTELIRESRLREIEGHLQAAADLAGKSQITDDELQEILRVILKGE